MRCLYSNADQLLNKIEDLKMMIAKESPDIMMFNEVIPKAQKNPILESQMTVPGFVPYVSFKFSDENLGASGKRGVAIYVRDNIPSEEIKLKTAYEDQLWVQINLKGRDSLLCGCVYRSPVKEKSKLKETTQKMCEILAEAAERDHSHMIVCGDFNYP